MAGVGLGVGYSQIKETYHWRRCGKGWGFLRLRRHTIGGGGVRGGLYDDVLPYQNIFFFTTFGSFYCFDIVGVKPEMLTMRNANCSSDNSSMPVCTFF